MEGRRRITLYDQMTAGNSSRDSLASLMLDDVVFKNTETAEARRELSRNRTLQEIIRKEEANNNNNDNSTKDRNSWRALKKKLGLKRTIGSSTNSNYNKDDNDTNLPETRPDLDPSTQQNDAVVEDVNDSDPIAQLESDEAAVGVPLMDLLEETEQEVDLYGMSDDDDDVTNYEKGEQQKEGVQEVGGLVEYNCCVCMVRHKGAAFIPCGHTFCRMCSREIWVSRGNCPLCNNLILEILDIF